MPLILAIEPDRRQASKITALTRGPLAPLHVELLITDSAEQGIAALGERVPDLILTPQLLLPRDEAALADRLRDLDDAGAHVQTLVIPQLGGSAPREESGGGLFGRLRRSKKDSYTEGCDPAVFGQQISEYLERAATERAVRAALLREQAAAAAANARTEAQRTADAPPAFSEPPPEFIEPDPLSAEVWTPPPPQPPSFDLPVTAAADPDVARGEPTGSAFPVYVPPSFDAGPSDVTNPPEPVEPELVAPELFVPLDEVVATDRDARPAILTDSAPPTEPVPGADPVLTAEPIVDEDPVVTVEPPAASEPIVAPEPVFSTAEPAIVDPAPLAPVAVEPPPAFIAPVFAEAPAFEPLIEIESEAIIDDLPLSVTDDLPLSITVDESEEVEGDLTEAAEESDDVAWEEIKLESDTPLASAPENEEPSHVITVEQIDLAAFIAELEAVGRGVTEHQRPPDPSPASMRPPETAIEDHTAAAHLSPPAPGVETPVVAAFSQDAPASTELTLEEDEAPAKIVEAVDAPVIEAADAPAVEAAEEPVVEAAEEPTLPEPPPEPAPRQDREPPPHWAARPKWPQIDGFNTDAELDTKVAEFIEALEALEQPAADDDHDPVVAEFESSLEQPMAAPRDTSVWVPLTGQSTTGWPRPERAARQNPVPAAPAVAAVPQQPPAPSKAPTPPVEVTIPPTPAAVVVQPPMVVQPAVVEQPAAEPAPAAAPRIVERRKPLKATIRKKLGKKKKAEPEKRAAVVPVQDEWGLFDPQQCGFAALLDKLDEITVDKKKRRNR